MKVFTALTVLLTCYITCAQISQATYYNSECSGEPVSTSWYPADKCFQSGSSFAKYSCTGGVLVTSTCTTSTCDSCTQSPTQYPANKCTNLLIASVYVKCDAPVPTGSSRTALVQSFADPGCSIATSYTEYPITCMAASTSSRRTTCGPNGLTSTVFGNAKCENAGDCSITVNSTCSDSRKLLRCAGHSIHISIWLLVAAILALLGIAF